MLSEDNSTSIKRPSTEKNRQYTYIIDFFSYIEKEGLKRTGISHKNNKNEQIHILLC